MNAFDQAESELSPPPSSGNAFDQAEAFNAFDQAQSELDSESPPPSSPELLARLAQGHSAFVSDSGSPLQAEAPDQNYNRQRRILSKPSDAMVSALAPKVATLLQGQQLATAAKEIDTPNLPASGLAGQVAESVQAAPKTFSDIVQIGRGIQENNEDTVKAMRSMAEKHGLNPDDFAKLPPLWESYLRGAGNAVVDTALGLTSPAALATGGFGGLPKVVQKTASIGFAAQMISGQPELARQLLAEEAKPADERDNKKIMQLMVNSIANAQFGTLAALHGVTPDIEPSVSAKPQPPEPQQAQQVTPPVESETPATQSDIFDSPEVNAAAARDRVNMAVSDPQKPSISGLDARIAGASTRLPEMGYAYDAQGDIYHPVKVVQQPTTDENQTQAQAQPNQDIQLGVPVKEGTQTKSSDGNPDPVGPNPATAQAKEINAVAPSVTQPVVPPPLKPLPGDRMVTVQRPDGTTYQAAYGDKAWQGAGPNGEDVSMIATNVDGRWGHGMLPEGDKIVENKSNEIPNNNRSIPNSVSDVGQNRSVPSGNLPSEKAPRSPVEDADTPKTYPQSKIPERFDTIADVLKFKQQRIAEEIGLYQQEIGLTRKEATQLADVLARDASVDKFNKTLTPEKAKRVDDFFENSPFNQKSNPFQFWEHDKNYRPEDVEFENDIPELALSLIRATQKGIEPAVNSDRFLYTAIVAKKLQELGATKTDLLKVLDQYTTRNSHSQNDKTDLFFYAAEKMNQFLASQGVNLSDGEFGKKSTPAPEAKTIAPTKPISALRSEIANVGTAISAIKQKVKPVKVPSAIALNQVSALGRTGETPSVKAETPTPSVPGFKIGGKVTVERQYGVDATVHKWPDNKVKITGRPDLDVAVYESKSGWIVFDGRKAYGKQSSGVGTIGFDSRIEAVENYVSKLESEKPTEKPDANSQSQEFKTYEDAVKSTPLPTGKKETISAKSSDGKTIEQTGTSYGGFLIHKVTKKGKSVYKVTHINSGLGASGAGLPTLDAAKDYVRALIHAGVKTDFTDPAKVAPEDFKKYTQVMKALVLNSGEVPDYFKAKPPVESKPVYSPLAQVGDEVSWKTGAGDMARSSVSKIDQFQNEKEPMAHVDWFGSKRVPVSQLGIIKKSNRRIAEEKRLGISEDLEGAKKPVEQPAVKEPWQMTKAEFEAWHLISKNQDSLPAFYAHSDPRNVRLTDAERAALDRRGVVGSALKYGKPVPPEVLADYPDLKPVEKTSEPTSIPPEKPVAKVEGKKGGSNWNEIISTAASEAQKATEAWGKHSVDVVEPLKSKIRKLNQEVQQMHADAQRTKPETKGKNKLTKKAFMEMYGVSTMDEATALYKKKNAAWADAENELVGQEMELKKLADAKDRRGQEWSKAVSKSKEQPPTDEGGKPFQDWRVQGTTIRHSGVGKQLTESEAKSIMDGMAARGMRGRYVTENGTVVLNSGLASDLENYWMESGSYAKNAEASKADRQARESDQAARQAETKSKLSGSSASGWIDKVFGADAMNDHNKLELVKFLTGETEKFGGLASPKWRSGLESLDAITDNTVDFKKIKSAFESDSEGGQPTPKPTEPTPVKPGGESVRPINGSEIIPEKYAHYKLTANNEGAAKTWGRNLEGYYWGDSPESDVFSLIDKTTGKSKPVWKKDYNFEKQDTPLEVGKAAFRKAADAGWEYFFSGKFDEDLFNFRKAWEKMWGGRNEDEQKTYSTPKGKSSADATKEAIENAKRNGASPEFKALFGGIDPALVGTTHEKVQQFARSLGIEYHPIDSAKTNTEALNEQAPTDKSFKSKADALASKLDAFKSGIGKGGQLHAFGIAADLWDRAFNVAQALIRAGGTVADAVNAAINIIRAEHKSAFKEDAAREAMTKNLESPEVTKSIDDSKQKRAQVSGITEIGQLRDTERIKPTTDQIRAQLFDGTQPVSPEATGTAWEQVEKLTNPATRLAEASRISAMLGDSRIGGSLHWVELMRYALKQAVAGDTRLLHTMLDRSNDFFSMSGGGASTAGSNLRGAKELNADPVLKELKLLFNEQLEAMGPKATGLHREIFMSLVEQLKNMKLDPDEVEKFANEGKLPDGRTLQDVLGEVETPVDEPAIEKSAAQKYAEQKLKQLEEKQSGVEWIKDTTKRQTVRQIIANALTRFNERTGKGNPNPVDANWAENIKQTEGNLVVAGVDPKTAHALATAIEQERTTDWVNARSKAMEKAANSKRLGSLIESILASPLRAQGDPQWVHDTAVRWFESNGLSKDQAETASRVFQEQFQRALADARGKIAEQVLSKSNTGNHDDLIKLIKTGALDPNSSWVEKAASKLGWRVPTADEYKRLLDLQKKWEDDSLSIPEKNAIIEQMDAILRHMAPKEHGWIKMLSESMAASLLSGPKTAILHIFQPVFSLVVKDFPTILLAQPKDLPTMAQSFLAAAKNWLPEFKYAWQHDSFGFEQSKMNGFYSELKRQFDVGIAEWKSGEPKARSRGALRLLYAVQKYVFRFLQSANQAGMAVRREFALSMYGSRVMREAGFSTQNIAEMAHTVISMKEALYNNGIERGLDKSTAAVRADSIAAEQIEAFFANKVGGTMAQEIATAAEHDAYSTTGFRAPGIKEHDEGFGRNAIGVTKLMETMTSLRKDGGLKSMFGILGFGFVNVPLRTMLYYSNYSPIGFYRYGIYKYLTTHGKETPWKQSYANDQMAKQRLYEGIVGTALLSMLGAWSWGHSTADDNSDKPFFLFATGKGPQNKTLRDAWTKSGYRPFSLAIGLDGKVVASVPINRVGGALAWIGGLAAASDDAAWVRKEAAAAGRPIDRSFSQLAGQAAGTYYETVGAQGIFQGINHLGQITEGGGGMAKVLASFASSAVSSTLIPGKQLIASISQMIWGNPDRSSISAAVAANFPILGMPWKHPQVNSLGDPIGDNSWYGKIANLGLPITFRVSDTQDNRQLYTMLVEKGAAPPNLSRSTLEDKYGPLTDDQFEQYAMKRGSAIKQQLLSGLSGLQSASPDQVKKSLGAIASRVDSQTATGMGLIPEATSKSAGASPARSSRPQPRVPSFRQPTQHALRPHTVSAFRLGKAGSHKAHGLTASVTSSLRSHHRSLLR